MDWIEVRVSTTSAGTEAVFGVLLTCGINGAQIVDNQDMRRFLQDHPYTWDYVDEKLWASAGGDKGADGHEHKDEYGYEDESYQACEQESAQVIFYVSPDPAGREILLQVKERLRVLKQLDTAFPLDGLGRLGGLGGLGSLTVDESAVNDESWLHEWKKYYKPFKLGRTVVVKPVWESYEAVPGEVVFTIDPGAVFGTGLHPSTQLCVEALEDYLVPDDVVLDIGSGSGILSIISLLLGAGFALACDYEPAAAVNAADNARLNQIDLTRYAICTGDIFTDKELAVLINRRQYAVVIANIVADVVMSLAAQVKGYVQPGGVFIASGVIAERVDEVRSTFMQTGFDIVSVLERDGWNCLICRNIS